MERRDSLGGSNDDLWDRRTHYVRLEYERIGRLSEQHVSKGSSFSLAHTLIFLGAVGFLLAVFATSYAQDNFKSFAPIVYTASALIVVVGLVLTVVLARIDSQQTYFQARLKSLEHFLADDDGSKTRWKRVIRAQDMPAVRIAAGSEVKRFYREVTDDASFGNLVMDRPQCGVVSMLGEMQRWQTIPVFANVLLAAGTPLINAKSEDTLEVTVASIVLAVVLPILIYLVHWRLFATVCVRWNFVSETTTPQLRLAKQTASTTGDYFSRFFGCDGGSRQRKTLKDQPSNSAMPSPRSTRYSQRGSIGSRGDGSSGDNGDGSARASPRAGAYV